MSEHIVGPRTLIISLEVGIDRRTLTSHSRSITIGLLETGKKMYVRNTILLIDIFQVVKAFSKTVGQYAFLKSYNASIFQREATLATSSTSDPSTEISTTSSSDDIYSDEAPPPYYICAAQNVPENPIREEQYVPNNQHLPIDPDEKPPSYESVYNNTQYHSDVPTDFGNGLVASGMQYPLSNASLQNCTNEVVIAPKMNPTRGATRSGNFTGSGAMGSDSYI